MNTVRMSRSISSCAFVDLREKKKVKTKNKNKQTNCSDLNSSFLRSASSRTCRYLFEKFELLN